MNSDSDIGKGIVIDNFRNLFITGNTDSFGARSTDIYYLTDEGRRIVRLMYYFRDYYRNRTNIL